MQVRHWRQVMAACARSFVVDSERMTLGDLLEAEITVSAPARPPSASTPRPHGSAKDLSATPLDQFFFAFALLFAVPHLCGQT